MPYYHVLAKIGNDKVYRKLFVDLDEKALNKNFLKAYRKNKAFLSGNEQIKPAELLSIKIIRTENKSQLECDERLRNTSALGLFMVSSGILATAGTDVTNIFIKGGAGYKAGFWPQFMKVGSLIGAIVGGVAKWKGWL